MKRATERGQARVVVVTGASSGIGKAAALAFAKAGDHVVLAARGAEGLDETAAACRELGGHVVTVVTDITRDEDVDQLVTCALEHNGRIDVWVNNAGVTLFAPLETAPFEHHERVIAVNVVGTMRCARAAMRVFREQRRGVMINVSSVLGQVGQAMVPSYVVSKFAMRGLTEALRSEVADMKDIHICSIFPYAIDTPHFETGANFIGKRAFLLSPAQSPRKVASAILDISRRPRRVRFVPRYIVAGVIAHALWPRRVEHVLLKALHKWHLAETQAPTVGNLYEPKSQRGDTKGHRPPRVSTARLVTWAALQMLVS